MNAISKTYSPLFGHEIDPLNNIVIGAGATEATFATIQALINPGDEVILFEPFYDSYPAQITMAGGIPKYVPLRPTGSVSSSSDWKIDEKELRSAFSKKTRGVIINTPHNPIGKVFSESELEIIASIVKEHDAIAFADEVYEWLVYKGSQHTRIASLPGMWERTVTLGSAGKTFSATGWKVGWAIAPEHLARAIALAHQWIPFCVSTPLQEAVAVGE